MSHSLTVQLAVPACGSLLFLAEEVIATEVKSHRKRDGFNLVFQLVRLDPASAEHARRAATQPDERPCRLRSEHAQDGVAAGVTQIVTARDYAEPMRPICDIFHCLLSGSNMRVVFRQAINEQSAHHLDR